MRPISSIYKSSARTECRRTTQITRVRNLAKSLGVPSYVIQHALDITSTREDLISELSKHVKSEHVMLANLNYKDLIW